MLLMIYVVEMGTIKVDEVVISKRGFFLVSWMKEGFGFVIKRGKDEIGRTIIFEHFFGFKDIGVVDKRKLQDM
jgi:hypothetical protein